jgi:hypothetical protein
MIGPSSRSGPRCCAAHEAFTLPTVQPDLKYSGWGFAKNGPPASLPAGLMRNGGAVLALAVAAAPFLVESLNQAAGVSSSRSNSSSNEGKGDKGRN